ncbi:hypothetical protein C0993_009817 [Termitomyces sp. T159_Od127]|nr:hypothetical protein C0993_009817 [Termitomyces sp. T159_Od127]
MSSQEEAPGLSRRVSAWIPVAAFAGTSIALAIPLVALARQRNSVLRKALSETNAAPPRRSVNLGRLNRASTPSSQTTEAGASVHFSAPGTGELLSAISKVDSSTAIWAGKAFMIATGIVTVGGVALVVGVKSMMGVKDTKDFANRMRMLVWRCLPSLTSQIHRLPDEDDQSAPHSKSLDPDPTWKWEEAEKRLQASYQEGGFPAWTETAMKELESEVKIERARRQKEYESAEANR